MTSKDKFIAQLDDKISQIGNEDAVRAEALKREIADGTMDQTVSNAVNIIADAYTKALNVGLSDDQAFYFACKTAGVEMTPPYTSV
ncbi:hypothetical protein FD13_GL001185 [Levilactobacillus senmaizukei DSM 21775 = NBRC 103853]|uniref:Uncharacterized protein n=1 Tax=Levilactobacillus senmaizukei DSM 21775 = NBRC 103853 TaxID=1423803 RepID=A0A0R2DBP0_9LACO|nr:hypothetical protein [Levilactobacillus senmaizukei]KRN01273.1 hypothetical protein FD13_GL001185 [Levilactobacillus senmaizukei DSM 21775 = NBRC 103853]